MRLFIIAVGRLKAGPHEALARYYADRLTMPLTIREVEEKRPLPPAELREREAALLLAAVPQGATIVALDARGTALGSEAFAERLARWRARGVAELAFLIGGAEGLAESVRAAAELVLSLGPMTWPHLLARGMLLEQFYRAQQILAGHPYHRG
ncbi:MAG TPA: 23S rRNA (pseudouridine(1915)-N(3))-methyltransferase RlmH [Stellaceae bacterium]|nr:23S rRNA (pseudouridine(1915)-N(3))-methyltransferase RlmH [Stellaceae bacterium]